MSPSRCLFLFVVSFISTHINSDNHEEYAKIQDRVINNAFYAASEKRKQNLHGFEPTISVTTKGWNSGGQVEVKITVNGSGISGRIREKIFQPSFTTKPTGQATGLGLSLSYDIIKAQGGTLEVNSKEGQGSEFVVQLPI